MTVIHITNIPVELRNAYKALCAAQGIDMTRALIRFIESEVKKAKK